MRYLLMTVVLLAAINLKAQNDIGWMAPEGKIINNRTLTWDDFLGEPDEELGKYDAAVRPAVYYSAGKGVKQSNGRYTFPFKVKCAFQSAAFVRERIKGMHDKGSDLLVHEQNHYDVALTYAHRLYEELSSRDYSANDYSAEMRKIYHDLYAKYNKTQDDYDGESNHGLIKEQQRLWDLRIKKCLENNTIEFYYSPESVVQSAKAPGQIVKRKEGEPALQFAVRCRPLYSELPQELMLKVMEVNEWGGEPSVVAFYTQHYTAEDGTQPKDCHRTLAYIFVPTTKDVYKRLLIDTIGSGEKPLKITNVFYANADSDNVKELVICATATEKNKQVSGTVYINKVYDNIVRPLPGKMKRLETATAKIEGGVEGTNEGKPSKAKYKTEAEVKEALKKAGY